VSDETNVPSYQLAPMSALIRTVTILLLVVRDTLVLFPLLFGLPHLFGINGVWMAQPLANALAFLFILFWTKRQYRVFESRMAD